MKLPETLFKFLTLGFVSQALYAKPIKEEKNVTPMLSPLEKNNFFINRYGYDPSNNEERTFEEFLIESLGLLYKKNEDASNSYENDLNSDKENLKLPEQDSEENNQNANIDPNAYVPLELSEDNYNNYYDYEDNDEDEKEKLNSDQEFNFKPYENDDQVFEKFLSIPKYQKLFDSNGVQYYKNDNDNSRVYVVFKKNANSNSPEDVIKYQIPYEIIRKAVEENNKLREKQTIINYEGNDEVRKQREVNV